MSRIITREKSLLNIHIFITKNIFYTLPHEWFFILTSNVTKLQNYLIEIKTGVVLPCRNAAVCSAKTKRWPYEIKLFITNSLTILLMCLGTRPLLELCEFSVFKVMSDIFVLVWSADLFPDLVLENTESKSTLPWHNRQHLHTGTCSVSWQSLLDPFIVFPNCSVAPRHPLPLHTWWGSSLLLSAKLYKISSQHSCNTQALFVKKSTSSNDTTSCFIPCSFILLKRSNTLVC